MNKLAQQHTKKAAFPSYKSNVKSKLYIKNNHNFSVQTHGGYANYLIRQLLNKFGYLQFFKRAQQQAKSGILVVPYDGDI